MKAGRNGAQQKSHEDWRTVRPIHYSLDFMEIWKRNALTESETAT